MKTIFDKTTRDELIARINMLKENNIAQWGKMNSYGMLRHCTLFEELIHGRKKYKQSFIGRIFGRMALKNMLKDETALSKNMPTVKGFAIKDNTVGDIDTQRTQWIALIEEYGNFSNHHFIHPFFGKMTKEQIGMLVYKHTDHHLRQFNV